MYKFKYILEMLLIVFVSNKKLYQEYWLCINFISINYVIAMLLINFEIINFVVYNIILDPKWKMYLEESTM